MLRVLVAPAISVAALLTAAPVHAQDAAVQQGRAFAQANCARCHAIGAVGDSPLPKAPPFRTLHQRYPVENLIEALAEGIRNASSVCARDEIQQRPYRSGKPAKLFA
jgi:cytochrome c